MENLIEVKSVVKNYAAHRALNGVSISIPKGSIFGLLGPNGAGKTSLIRMITMITGIDEGEILFNGEPLSRTHIADIGYLPEERGLYKKMKVGEQLVYLARLKGMSSAQATKNLKEWFKRLDITAWWDKKIDELSKGMQQKVQFIATVVHNPKLIILDEPFTGFDPVNANIIKGEILKLKENGATIIFSTHRMESVEELCSHIALINKSQLIVQGEVNAVKKAYSKNLWNVETSGSIATLPDNFKIESSEQDPSGITKSTIAFSEGANTTVLLQNILSQGLEISKFEHIEPGINDIFISLVNPVNQ